MDRKVLENAILTLGKDPELLARFKAAPIEVGAEMGLDAHWARVVASGNRDELRARGLPDGVTILVSRWFQDELGDRHSKGRFEWDGQLSSATVSLPRNLCFAGGCSHVPDLLARPEVDPPEAVARLLSGYAKLRQSIAAARLDVILISADCHFQSFETAATVVGVGTRHSGSMAFFKRPDLDADVAGDPSFALALVDAVRAVGLEVEAARRVDLDHGLIVPLRLLIPGNDIKVIPIITQPARGFSPFNARLFGEALRPAIEASGKRVGFLATGGLSHWLDPGKYGFVDEAFDGFVLDLLRAGRGLDLSSLEPYPLLEHGQYEFLNWLIMLAVAGAGLRGEVYAYEPLRASGGGWTVVDLPLTGLRGPAPTRGH
jgi:aromatic ring-opening dioxygenase catalytic subunit (LigB family)